LKQEEYSPVSKESMKRLELSKWLNDEIIDFYMKLLSKRADDDESLSRIHCFSSYFFTTMKKKHGYSAVKNWTRTVSIYIAL
jgi:Ulp1 family protease